MKCNSLLSKYKSGTSYLSDGEKRHGLTHEQKEQQPRPQGFSLKMGGAGKGPGNGWSRVLFPPYPYPYWELGTGKTAKQS